MRMQFNLGRSRVNARAARAVARLSLLAVLSLFGGCTVSFDFSAKLTNQMSKPPVTVPPARGRVVRVTEAKQNAVVNPQPESKWDAVRKFANSGVLNWVKLAR